jgi:predicted negative regulator of RcsB-dependent stress response
MVHLLRSFILVIVALSVLTVVVPARAQTASECQPQITALRQATVSATFTGQNPAKDQVGLIGKLDSATTKVEQGKIADAVQALTQVRDKVVTLQAQGKIDSGDAAVLIAGADDAIACLEPPAA